MDGFSFFVYNLDSKINNFSSETRESWFDPDDKARELSEQLT
jgi:hypothetical protein